MELSGRVHESNNPFGSFRSFQFTEINLLSQVVGTTFQLLFLSLESTKTYKIYSFSVSLSLSLTLQIWASKVVQW